MAIVDARSLGKAKAANPHLGKIVTLPEFLATTGVLTEKERVTIVRQALAIIDDVYVHLPMKQAMHAVDPVQRLKLLDRRLRSLTERQFHDEMISIFVRLRDLHTNYILPSPYNAHTAFLPFLMEEYYDAAGTRRYMVTHMLAGFQSPSFGIGDEITHWSGVPIAQAIAINADREAGSNEDARHVRGLDNMTVRPMAMSLPPDEEWVIVGYLRGAKALEIRLPWQVFQPDPAPPGSGLGGGKPSATSVAMGLDLKMELINRSRKALFKKPAVALGMQAKQIRRRSSKKARAEFMGANSLYPDTFQFRAVKVAGRDVGYLRIRTFSEPEPDQFIPEVIRILEQLPQEGLLIDVRGNGGGFIMNGERMLQLFSPRPVEAERLHFINTPVTLAIAKSDVWDGFAKQWVKSIDLAVETGAIYSQGFPIEDSSITNAIGRKYLGKVVVITDARCYSTTDIFVAGFQDNKLGRIVGVDRNTGAGGANVFGHDLLLYVLDGVASPFAPLPKEAAMRVAIRQTTRIGENAGLPVEDLGVTPDKLHRMTRDDMLHDNRDLIVAAASLLE